MPRVVKLTPDAVVAQVEHRARFLGKIRSIAGVICFVPMQGHSRPLCTLLGFSTPDAQQVNVGVQFEPDSFGQIVDTF